MKGAVQLVAFDEPTLTETMDAWAGQTVPDGVDVVYEAWITPKGSVHEDPTWQQAVEHPVFQPRETPKFKLPSRNVAHEAAAGRGDDFFVACDADAPPLGDGVLSALTAPLVDSSPSAVVSNPVAAWRRPAGARANVGTSLKEAVGGIHGQCHLVTTDAWQVAGPFDEDLDHTNIIPVWMEEEYDFGRRLRLHGPVVYRAEARVLNDTRRKDCSYQRALRRPQDPWCRRKEGSETFAPRRPYR